MEELDTKDSQEDRAEHRGHTHSPCRRLHKLGRGRTATVVRIRTADVKGRNVDAEGRTIVQGVVPFQLGLLSEVCRGSIVPGWVYSSARL